MTNSMPAPPRPGPAPAAGADRRATRRGFTLIETALALGIVAFALVPIFGLLPVGLQVSRSAADLTTTVQIAQRLASLIQQTDWSQYASLETTCYYFDGNGQPITAPATGTNAAPSIYSACILPPSSTNYTTLVDGTSVATLQIQVVNDPGQMMKTPQTVLPPALKAQAVVLPVYLANKGG